MLKLLRPYKTVVTGGDATLNKRAESFATTALDCVASDTLLRYMPSSLVQDAAERYAQAAVSKHYNGVSLVVRVVQADAE